MPEHETATSAESAPLRVLFCLAVSQEFFSADDEERDAVRVAVEQAFADLRGRFGIAVLGTHDDDRWMVGPALGWPWNAYILADCPTLDSVAAVCDIMRQHPVGNARLWRYLRIEARIGRRLFFGNE